MAVPLGAVGSNSGDETARAQQRLLDLGFWLEAPDGQYGLTTRQAVMAFQKYVGLNASGSLDGETAAYLSNMTEQAYGRADAGTMVEIDKARQLLFMIVDGRTQWVFNTSTGSEVSYVEVNQKDPTVVERGRLHHARRACTASTASGPRAGGRATSARSTARSTSSAASPSTAPTACRTTRPRTAACGSRLQAMDFIWDAGLMPMSIPVWVHT